MPLIHNHSATFLTSCKINYSTKESYIYDIIIYVETILVLSLFNKSKIL